MKTLVINLTRTKQEVSVRHSDGTLDSVAIMPQRRVELREGMSVDTRWQQLNPNVIRVVEPEKAAPAKKLATDNGGE